MELALVAQSHAKLVQVQMFASNASPHTTLLQQEAVILALRTAQTVQTPTPARNAKMDYISMVNTSLYRLAVRRLWIIL